MKKRTTQHRSGAQITLDLANKVERIGDVERELFASGHLYVIGTDEVGRGPLAGPVTTAAVLMRLDDLAWCSKGINDSKKLSEAQREALVPTIQAAVIDYEIVDMAPEDVDRLNVLWASMEGMRRCVEALRARNEHAKGATVLVDGNRKLREITATQRSLIKGDNRSYAIAAASILAKVCRDHQMVAYDEVYPGYGFARHKGYPTAQHRGALITLGVTPIHRRSFRAVAEKIRQETED